MKLLKIFLWMFFVNVLILSACGITDDDGGVIKVTKRSKLLLRKLLTRLLQIPALRLRIPALRLRVPALGLQIPTRGFLLSTSVLLLRMRPLLNWPLVLRTNARFTAMA
ncbi:hypothetical protein WDW89_17035 [Deltaproteobacteria bacterium TL4]